MSGSRTPRVLSIDAGVPFLPELADALLDGRLVEGFRADGDPLKLASATIFVPTRRAARALRAIFAEKAAVRSAILPVIRPLGEFDEDAAFFDAAMPDLPDLAPAIAPAERLLALAPLVQRWRRNLPGHVAKMFGGEPVTVPASFSDAIWLARDLAALIDEVETEGAEWSRLTDLAGGELAEWWQVTLEFLAIVTRHWPEHLSERNRSNPAFHRNALIDAEAGRLAARPPEGPVIAAGSTGSIPATARLLATIARLPQGAVVLPGLDHALDERAWGLIGEKDAAPSVFGHPQFGLRKLLARLDVSRGDVIPLGAASPALAARRRIVGEALRPAEVTESWATGQSELRATLDSGALDGVALVEAANEREEAMAIAVALREAVERGERTAALLTGDRALARRVAAELLRFGIRADDSGGTPLAATPPATLLALLVQCALRPGDPVNLLALVKHPLLNLSTERAVVREAAEHLELVVLRGGTGRPDLATLPALLETRIEALAASTRPPFWLGRLDDGDFAAIRDLADRLARAAAPLFALRNREDVTIAEAVAASAQALETAGQTADGGLGALYDGDNGDRLAEFLRSHLAAGSETSFSGNEWPDVLAALIAPETVKPTAGADRRVVIWGQLEARLQPADTLVLGGLNEGSWPRRAEPDRFMSRLMKTSMDLEPPERRIGQAAHDFEMAMGAPRVILTRSVRAENAPAVASRWLQRLTTFAGKEASDAMRRRGHRYIAWANRLDAAERVDFAARPRPKPALDLRPRHFSVTEIETLRRDPYAIHARRILRLEPLDELLRDPGAAERGNLFHDILHRFTVEVGDPRSQVAVTALMSIGRACFDELALPGDVEAVWWPRFVAMAPHILEWERGRAEPGLSRHAEIRAERTEIALTGVTLSGRADRIDRHADGRIDIIDYKTGSAPSPKQARTLLAPQLALEGALAARGAFKALGGAAEPAGMAYVRLKPDGTVLTQSILDEKGKQVVTGPELSAKAWEKLGELIAYFQLTDTGYVSRLLPFREGDTEGPYDHLARVLEWSSGSDADAEAGE